MVKLFCPSRKRLFTAIMPAVFLFIFLQLWWNCVSRNPMNSFSDSYITRCIQPCLFNPYLCLVGHLAHFLSKSFGGYFIFSFSHTVDDLLHPNGWLRVQADLVGISIMSCRMSLGTCWLSLSLFCWFVVWGELLVCLFPFWEEGMLILGPVLGLKFKMCSFAPIYIL